VNDRLSSSLLDGLAEQGLPTLDSWTWGREPLIIAGMARALAQRFDWFSLERMLASAEADVVLTSSAPVASWVPPRDLEQLRHCFGSKIGLTVRGAERFCPVSRAVVEDLRALGPARVHLIATPPDQGTSWHYEDEHVLIVQTAGVKDYYFRANTIASEVPASARAFAAHDGESSRLWSARLQPGDVLYLPARWWIRSRSEQDTLSLSIGVSLPALPRHGIA
jgi:ribosomal protein L16 Arg81 hydroxylase